MVFSVGEDKQPKKLPPVVGGVLCVVGAAMVIAGGRKGA